MAFLVPKLFVATHWYKPLSTGRKFLIVRLPSLTSVFLAGKGITSLIQVNLGGGYPSAWQVSCIVADSIFETSDEGFLVKIGRPKRRRINMIWLEKAIVFSRLLIETTQKGDAHLKINIYVHFLASSTHHVHMCKS